MSNLTISNDEIIPAISPADYPKNKRHLKETIQRKVLKADKRKSKEQLFFYDSFDQPLTDQAEIYEKPLHYVRMAPSAKNKQPWRILVSKDLSKVHFYMLSTLADENSYACEPYSSYWKNMDTQYFQAAPARHG